MRYKIALMAALLASVGLARASSARQIEIDGPDVFLKGVRFPVTVSAPRALESVHVVVRLGDGTVVADTTIDPLGSITVGNVVVENAGQVPLRAEAGGEVVTLDRRIFPGWISILPPLVAVVLALVFREVRGLVWLLFTA